MATAQVLGICGCEGAGKTTIAEMLVAGPKPKYVKHEWMIPSPKATVIQALFGLDIRGVDPTIAIGVRDPIWNMTGAECIELIEQLMHTHVDPDWCWECCAHALTWHGLNSNSNSSSITNSTANTNSISINVNACAFADALKYVAAILFNVDYDMLIGRTQTAREQRLQPATPNYKICGVLTGRQILEYFGTDIMRNQFDDEIWIKILMRNVAMHREMGKTVVVPDVRFRNEKNAIAKLGGELLVVFRDPSDLEITDSDRASHPAKWHFKTFINDTDIPIRKIHNSDDITALQYKLDNLTI